MCSEGDTFLEKSLKEARLEQYEAQLDVVISIELAHKKSLAHSTALELKRNWPHFSYMIPKPSLPKFNRCTMNMATNPAGCWPIALGKRPLKPISHT